MSRIKPFLRMLSPLTLSAQMPPNLPAASFIDWCGCFSSPFFQVMTVLSGVGRDKRSNIKSPISSPCGVMLHFTVAASSCYLLWQFWESLCVPSTPCLWVVASVVTGVHWDTIVPCLMFVLVVMGQRHSSMLSFSSTWGVPLFSSMNLNSDPARVFGYDREKKFRTSQFEEALETLWKIKHEG